MSKTSAAVKNRYAAKAYDRIGLVVPKGRKEDIVAQADSKGISVNTYITNLIKADMQLSDEEWKNKPDTAQ